MSMLLKIAGAALFGLNLLNAQVVPSQRDLEDWLAAWQNKLQLQEWHIWIRAADRRELGPYVNGDTHFGWPKLAAIRVIDGRESLMPPEKILTYSQLVVVHELVHVAFVPLAPDPKAERMVDRAVEDVAEALLFAALPACVAPRTFMDVEIGSLPGALADQRSKDGVAAKLTSAFLDGRRGWSEQHNAACAAGIKNFFARSGWR